MLDSNTNKIVWVAVALGIVAMLGFGTMSLYPDALTSMSGRVAKLADDFANKPDKPKDTNNLPTKASFDLTTGSGYNGVASINDVQNELYGINSTVVDGHTLVFDDHAGSMDVYRATNASADNADLVSAFTRYAVGNELQPSSYQMAVDGGGFIQYKEYSTKSNNWSDLTGLTSTGVRDQFPQMAYFEVSTANPDAQMGELSFDIGFPRHLKSVDGKVVPEGSFYVHTVHYTVRNGQ